MERIRVCRGGMEDRGDALAFCSFLVAPSQMRGSMCLTGKGRILSSFWYFLRGLSVTDVF